MVASTEKVDIDRVTLIMLPQYEDIYQVNVTPICLKIVHSRVTLAYRQYQQ